MMKAVGTFVLLQIVGLQAYNGRVRGPVEMQAGTFLRVEGEIN